MSAFLAKVWNQIKVLWAGFWSLKNWLKVAIGFALGYFVGRI